MENERERNGQFAKGYPGFKPVGALKRKSNYEMDKLKEIFDKIQPYLLEDLRLIGSTERIRTLITITKMLDAKKNRKMKTAKSKALNTNIEPKSL
jgi:hypothetical protein